MMNSYNSCLLCHHPDPEVVLDLGLIPAIQGAPIEEKHLGLEKVGHFTLGYCRNCGHVYNISFDSDLINNMYFENYSTALPESPSIRERFQFIANESVGADVIRNAVVLEVGASDFTFSKIMLGLKASQIVAFEPSSLFQTDDEKIVHIRSYFDRSHLDSKLAGTIDVIVARHVLEHMSNPLDSLKLMNLALQKGGHLYVEVPNLDDIVSNGRIYDLFYEHVSYFTPSMLTSVLNLAGFKILKITSLIGGQHFGVLCQKIGDFSNEEFQAPPQTELLKSLEGFKDRIQSFRDKMLSVLSGLRNPAIYGAGNHSISVTNLYKLTAKDISCLYDQNSFKANKLSPGSHIPIYVPTEESLNQHDGVIILASLHQDEIYKTLREKYNFKGKIIGSYPEIFELP